MWVVLFLDNPCHRITLLWGQEPFVCLSKGSCWEMGSSWERIGKKDVCIFWKRLVLSSFLLSLLFAGKDWGQEEKGMTEEEMVGRHHQHSSHGFGWTPGVGDGQGGLAYCSSWGCQESDMTEWLNWIGLYPVDASSILHFNGPKMFPDIAKFSLFSTGEEKLSHLRTTALYVDIDIRI